MSFYQNEAHTHALWLHVQVLIVTQVYPREDISTFVSWLITIRVPGNVAVGALQAHLPWVTTQEQGQVGNDRELLRGKGWIWWRCWTDVVFTPQHDDAL